jgi:hypothetical protein
LLLFVYASIDTVRPDKWVHVVYTLNVVVVEDFAFTLSESRLELHKIHKSLLKMRWVRGLRNVACTQCGYGRCATAANPWCAIQPSRGFSKQYQTEEDDTEIL